VLRDDGTLWLNLGDSYARQVGDDSTKATDTGFGEGRGTGRTGKSHLLFKTGNNRPPEGLKPKDLIGIPWMLAFALRADGWYLRQDIIWHKPNPMPESVRDRCTKAHEYIFLLSKSERYYFDSEAMKEDAISLPRPREKRNGESVVDTKQRGSDTCAGVDKTRNKRSVWTVATKPFRGAHFATFPPDLIEPCIKAGCPEGGTVLDPFGGSGTTGMVAQTWGRKFILCEMNPEYAQMARDRIAGEQDLFTV
jgi:site-specific DNA-methyltransferase (adenine-specific)